MGRDCFGYWVWIAHSCTAILLQIVIVSPGTNLGKNHESLSITSESQFKKTRSPKLKNLMLVLFCIQTANLETDAAKNSLLQFTEKRNHTNRIFYQRNLLIDQSFFVSYGSMPWIILSLWGFLSIRDAWFRDKKITGCTCIRGPYFCIFKYVRTVKQKVWSKGKKCGVALLTLNDFGKKSLTVVQFFWGGHFFRPEYEIVQSYNHAYLTLLFLGVTLWAISWTVSLSQDALRLMVLFAASFVVIGLIKRLDQSISPDFI